MIQSMTGFTVDRLPGKMDPSRLKCAPSTIDSLKSPAAFPGP